MPYKNRLSPRVEKHRSSFDSRRTFHEATFIEELELATVEGVGIEALRTGRDCRDILATDLMSPSQIPWDPVLRECRGQRGEKKKEKEKEKESEPETLHVEVRYRRIQKRKRVKYIYIRWE